MFKKHAIQVSVVKAKPAESDAESTPTIAVDPSEIAQIATEYTLKTVGAIGAVIAANRLLTAICDIAVLAAKAKIK